MEGWRGEGGRDEWRDGGRETVISTLGGNGPQNVEHQHEMAGGCAIPPNPKQASSMPGTPGAYKP